MLSALLGLTTISGLTLSYSQAKTYAEPRAVNASVTVAASACTMSSEISSEHSADAISGNYYTDIGTTRLTTVCNDGNGYSIYAVGFTGNELGNTKMIGTDPNHFFDTGTASGDVSNWSMKISKDNTSPLASSLTIKNGFSNYNNVPSNYVEVASFSPATTSTPDNSTSIMTSYAVRTSKLQPSDTYVGKVKYLMIHPYNNAEQLLGAIQDVTPSVCPTTPARVYDIRDNNIYTIQKLADGKCWLLDNLALDLTNATVKNNLSETNTNASDTTLGYLKNGGGTTSDQYAITGVIEWTSSPNYASSYSYSDPLIATSGTGNNGDWTKDTAAPLAMSQSGSGKIGVYYNYCAASAGSYCYGDGTSVGTSSGNATEDICPVGWRMPTGGDSGEYQALYAAYSSDNAAFVNALRTPLSGYFNNGSASIQGSGDGFWSSARGSSYGMYGLFVNTSVNPRNSSYRLYGYSIRCVLDPLTSYTVTYNKNTSDTVSNMPSEQTGSANFVNPITISNNTPTRSGYAFLGWCTTQPTTSNNTDSCSGTTYAPGSQLTPTGSTITLYAMWTAKYTVTLALTGNATGVTINSTNYTTSVDLTAGTYTISGSYASGYEFSSWSTSGSISVASTSSASTTLTVSGAGTLTLSGKESFPSLAMQNVTPATCPTTATRVYDNRDNSIYTIQKLADNRCWLLDNLALDLTNATVKANLSSTNTNASNTTLNYLKNGGGTTSDKYAITGVTNWTSSYSYSDPLIAVSGSSDIGDWTKNTTVSLAMGQSGTGKIGVYYNFCAASAGSYCYGNGTSYGTSSDDATEDICPAGWRMPTSGVNGEYGALLTAYSNDRAAFVNALRTPLSGSFNNGQASLQSPASYGYFWSSTRVDDDRMRRLSVDASSTLDTSSAIFRRYGYPIRCILDQVNSIADVRMMQKFGELDSSTKTAVVNSMTEGQQYTLTDSRDSKSYTVAKIGSNVWMTKNLDLAGGTTLTADDSNVSAGCNLGGIDNCTLPASSTSGFSDNATAYVYNSNRTACRSSSSPCYSYYSYAAATAGTNPSSGEATSDICPKGWRLPTNAEYTALKSTYTTGDTLTASPFYGVYAGGYSSNSFRNGNAYGYYWSSTAVEASYAFYHSFTRSSAYVYSGDRRNGYSVRCVAK